MPKKSNHKHLYCKHIVFKATGASRDIYDVVNVCSVCGRVKELPMRERMVRTADGTYRWPIYLEDLREYFGDLPFL